MAMCETNSSPLPSMAEIAGLTRDELIERLLRFKAEFPLDFTDSFLSRKSTDQLRHILIAACKQARKKK